MTDHDVCTHGGDCLVHPTAGGLHDYRPSAEQALLAVLERVTANPATFTPADVHSIARDLGVDLGVDVPGMPTVGGCYRRVWVGNPGRHSRVRWVRRVADGQVWHVAGPPGSREWSRGREVATLNYFMRRYVRAL